MPSAWCCGAGARCRSTGLQIARRRCIGQSDPVSASHTETFCRPSSERRRTWPPRLHRRSPRWISKLKNGRLAAIRCRKRNVHAEYRSHRRPLDAAALFQNLRFEQGQGGLRTTRRALTQLKFSNAAEIEVTKDVCGTASAGPCGPQGSWGNFRFTYARSNCSIAVFGKPTQGRNRASTKRK